MSIHAVVQPPQPKIRRTLNRIEHWRRIAARELLRINADPQAVVLLGQVAEHLRRVAFQTSVQNGNPENTP